jgi:group I intron endonuclease
MICYQITNLVSGKVYIGLTMTSIATRWRRHVELAARGQGYALHDAIRKYGVDSFLIEEVASPIEKDRDALAELERLLIAQAGSVSPGGYNLTAGGDGVGGCEATAKKISASLTGKKLTDAHRATLSESAKIRKPREITESMRSNMREGQKKRAHAPHTEATKEKCRLAGLKRKPIPLAAEHKAKLLALRVGSKDSEETREKKRIAALGRKPTDEARASMRAAQRRIADAKKATKEAILTASKQSNEEVK